MKIHPGRYSARIQFELVCDAFQCQLRGVFMNTPLSGTTFVVETFPGDDYRIAAEARDQCTRMLLAKYPQTSVQDYLQDKDKTPGWYLQFHTEGHLLRDSLHDDFLSWLKRGGGTENSS